MNFLSFPSSTSKMFILFGCVLIVLILLLIFILLKKKFNDKRVITKNNQLEDKFEELNISISQTTAFLKAMKIDKAIGVEHSLFYKERLLFQSPNNNKDVPCIYLVGYKVIFVTPIEKYEDIMPNILTLLIKTLNKEKKKREPLFKGQLIKFSSYTNDINLNGKKDGDVLYIIGYTNFSKYLKEQIKLQSQINLTSLLDFIYYVFKDENELEEEKKYKIKYRHGKKSYVNENGKRIKAKSSEENIDFYTYHVMHGKEVRKTL